MIKLKIDNIDLSVPVGTTILEAAKSIGIAIPSMCHSEQVENHASCLVCMVKNVNSSEFIPACEMKVQKGMDILSNHPEVIEARKEALELLLSDHVGDCEAPCRTTCPLYMEIPEMNRLIADKKFNEALKVVKKEIALPIILGYICHAPCENVCRRKEVDETISICKLKRFVAEENTKYIPKKENGTNKKIAIIGSGLSALSCAYHLLLKGHECTLYEKNPKPGGTLLDIDEKTLPKSAIENEIELLKKLGADFILNFEVSNDIIETKLTKDFDAIVIATGDNSNKFPISDNNKVFECGSYIKTIKKAVLAVSNGKNLAFNINGFLENERTEQERLFNSKFGKLKENELSLYLEEAINKEGNILSKETEIEQNNAIAEAKRCMRCDCRKPQTCKLRIYSDEYNAKQRTYKFDERKTIRKFFKNELAIYEPEKCIKCGLCIKVTEIHKEDFGLTFIGRGFDISIDIPFNKDLDEALVKAAKECVDICPTGALSNFNGE